MNPNDYQFLAMEADELGDDIESAAIILTDQIIDLAYGICKVFQEGDGVITDSQKLVSLEECGDALLSLTKIIDCLGNNLEAVMKKSIQKATGLDWPEVKSAIDQSYNWSEEPPF